MLYEKEDEIQPFSSLFLSSCLYTQRYVREYLCELLGGINGSARLLWGFVASLAIFLLIYHYIKF